MTEFEELRRRFAPAAGARPGDRGACPSPEDLAAAAERRSDADTRLRILEHVATCAACREEFDLLRAVAATGRPGPISRWLLVAIPLAAAAVLVLILRPVGPPAQPVVRNDGPALLLHTARPGAGGIRFAWRPLPSADHYAVEVFTLAGDSVALLDSRDTTLTVSRPPGVPDSALRWMVRAYLADGRIIESEPARLLEPGR